MSLHAAWRVEPTAVSVMLNPHPRGRKRGARTARGHVSYCEIRPGGGRRDGPGSPRRPAQPPSTRHEGSHTHCLLPRLCVTVGVSVRAPRPPGLCAGSRHGLSVRHRAVPLLYLDGP